MSVDWAEARESVKSEKQNGAVATEAQQQA
jgi:hypothetical protein